MIRIHRPPTPPRILQDRGRRTTAELQRAFEGDENGYRQGNKIFTFDATIYRAKSVKNALLKSQHAKCAFCESKVTHVAYGDVEHFRPKAGFRQVATDELGRPGYYWLAYEWDNLLFCCQLCNQRFKKNLFPLADPSRRAVCHRDDCGNEEPLFLNPAVDDPAPHIAFREEVAYPRSSSPSGQATIDALGLNREELRERRFDRLAFVRQLIRNQSAIVGAISILAPLDSPHRADVSATLKALQNCREGIALNLSATAQPAAEYSAMCRDVLLADSE